MFFETSAKTGFNAQKVFVEAANLLYEENLKYKERAGRENKNTNLGTIDFSPDFSTQLIIDDDNMKKKKKKCC